MYNELKIHNLKVSIILDLLNQCYFVNTNRGGVSVKKIGRVKLVER